MSDKMFARPMYKCAICEEIYDNVADRAACEIKCIKKVEEEAKKAEAEKKKAEQKRRMEEVDAAYEAYEKLAAEYIKDYYYVDENVTVDWLDFLSFFM